ncbi:MAG: extracellular solute-binding protein [Deinococcota bacterium]
MTVSLKGLTWDHPRGYAPLEAASTHYASLQDVHISWDKRSLKAFGDVPINTLAADYDLLVIDHPHMGIAAESGCLHPLDTLIDDGTLEQLARESVGPSHASYTYKGKQWALAVDAAVQVSCYRADLLTSPLPEDWQQVLELASSLHQDNLYLAIPLVPTDAMCSFLSLCASFGHPLSPTNFVSNAHAEAVLIFLKRLAECAHSNSLNWNPIHTYNAMSQGDEVAYCPLAFGYSNYARGSSDDAVLTFSNIPGVRGGLLGGAGIAVSRFSDHSQEAAEFAVWVSGNEVQAGVYVRAGGQPGNVMAWQDTDCNTLTNNFFKDTLATLEHAYMRPRDAGFVQFQEFMGERIHSFLRTEDNPKNCIQDLREAFEVRLEAS